jgi:hypothetical protein
MQQNSASGKIERKRVRMAISVLSFPVFGVPKWPKKLIFTRVPPASSVISGQHGFHRVGGKKTFDLWQNSTDTRGHG